MILVSLHSSIHVSSLLFLDMYLLFLFLVYLMFYFLLVFYLIFLGYRSFLFPLILGLLLSFRLYSPICVYLLFYLYFYLLPSDNDVINSIAYLLELDYMAGIDAANSITISSVFCLVSAFSNRAIIISS